MNATLEPHIIPPRSPDFYVMDFAMWDEIERRLRLQEKKFLAGKVESREEFKQRSGRVARNLPTKFIDDSIGDLAERCQKFYAAKGGLFEERGRKKRRRPL